MRVDSSLGEALQSGDAGAFEERLIERLSAFTASLEARCREVEERIDCLASRVDDAERALEQGEGRLRRLHAEGRVSTRQTIRQSKSHCSTREQTSESSSEHASSHASRRASKHAPV